MRLARRKVHKNHKTQSSAAFVMTDGIITQHNQQRFVANARACVNNLRDKCQSAKKFGTTLLIDSESLDHHSSRKILDHDHVTFTRTSGLNASNSNWVFPPIAPTPIIYNYENLTLTQSNERNGPRGLQKQFSGRFKRLVTKKTESTSAIPPELKPQLKTIYVY